MSWLSLGKQLPMILQNEAAECGAACLAMVSSFYGHNLNLAEVKQYLSVSAKGNNLKQLIAAAEALQLNSQAVKVEVDELAALAMPAIIHWDLNHFVVLKQIKGKQVVIHDPAKGERKLDLQEFAKHFTGIALELSPAAKFTKKKSAPALKISSLWSSISGLYGFLIQIFLLSFALEIFALLLPFYIQLVIDDGLVSKNIDFLAVLCAGFLFLYCINALTEVGRNWVVNTLNAKLDRQLSFNVASHLFKLPMAFFERRHIGDVLSRFGSLEMVLNIISRDLVEGLIDGLMMLGTLAMMFVYNSLLTLIPLIAILVYSAARFGFFFRLRARTEDFLVRSAREDSILIESIRGMLSLKVFNKDVERHQLWKGYYSDKVASHLAVQKNHNLFNGFESLLNGAEYVLVVFFGAVAVLHNHFSLGMLIAFLAYRTQFASKSKSFMQKLVDYKMLSLYLYRLSDIALADEEKNLNKPFPLQPEQIKGRIELQNISFRYTEGEPLLFENYSCTIEAGESVVLTGPSGCGKSTLLKIMMGLLKPSSGKVLIDGVELSEFGLRNYRSLIGAVMQEDKLFAGSIADNIAFFQPGYAQEEVEACAKLAAIHDSIIASTMGYQTLVGDMGAVLSGGQQQRILLARALFVQPKFLFLDEATSSLDKASESEVNNNIAKLGVTRVSIAHRQETIAMAGRQITLGA